MQQPSTAGISPAAAAAGATRGILDELLPLLASVWLSEGWDSDQLVELAGMSLTRDSSHGRRLLPSVLESLGLDSSDNYSGSATERFATELAWAVSVMDGPFTPFTAAQKVLEMADDEPALFDGLPGLDQLASQVATYEQADPAGRQEVGGAIRRHLLDLAQRLGPAA